MGSNDYDYINRVINTYLSNLREIDLNTVKSKGNDSLSLVHNTIGDITFKGKTLSIKHASGATIEFRDDGKAYYKSSTMPDFIEIGTGSGGSVTNPMTADLNTGGYSIKNTGGPVTFESSTGIFIFRKP